MTVIRIDECVYCGDPATENEHVTPRADGGRLTLPACRPCNREKGRREPYEWFAADMKGDYTRWDDERYTRWLRRKSRQQILEHAGVLDRAGLLMMLESHREDLLLDMRVCLTAIDEVTSWIESDRAVAS